MATQVTPPVTTLATRIAQIIQAAEQAQTGLFPLFFHSAQGQGIAAIVMVSESVAASLIAGIGAALNK